MVMYQEYLEDVKEYLEELTERFTQIRAVLKDRERMEEIWTKYQKNIEYGCDEEWALDDAIEEALHIVIPRHH